MSDSEDNLLADIPQLAARMELLKRAEQRFYTMFSPEDTPGAAAEEDRAGAEDRD